MDLLERKLKVLRRQKQLLQQEISDNKELGVKVSFTQYHSFHSVGFHEEIMFWLFLFVC